MITINLTYYNEPDLLAQWYECNQYILDNNLPYTIAVCDDGSQRKPAVDFFEKHEPPVNMKLYRVKEDLGFNSHGCRNLLMQQTKTDWNILSDIDRHITTGTLERISQDRLIEGQFYMFWMIKQKYWAVNDFLVHRNDFWEGGGYDERFVNVHWGDRMLFEDYLDVECKRIQDKRYIIKVLRGARDVRLGKNKLTLYPDDSTLIIPVSSWWNDADYRDKLIERSREIYRDQKKRKERQVVRFEWEQVF